MSHFAAIFSIEWKRFFKIKNLILFSIIFLFSHILLNMGVKDFRSSVEKSDKFRAIEVKNFEKHNLYSFYGDEGINTLFIPESTSVFFRNTPITNDLLSNVDSKVTVRIFNLYKGKSLYKRNLSGPWGVSDFRLLIVGLIAIFYGGTMVLRKTLGTSNPMMVVISQSMVPNLGVGDFIFIEAIDDFDHVIIDGPPLGDILVFVRPGYHEEYIVHRVIDGFKSDDGWIFQTKGDNNAFPDGFQVTEDLVVGRVINRLPVVGYFSLFIKTMKGFCFICIFSPN